MIDATQAAFMAILKDDKVLMVRSLTNPRYTDHWSFPGGLVDPGETPDQAAVREAVEEVGIHATVDRLIGEVTNVEDGLQVSIYAGTYVSGEITLLLDELEDARWFTVEEALKLPLAYEIERHLLEIL